MVQDIDFLPLSYKHDRQRRQKRISRRITLVVFLALIVAGTIQQRKTQSRLQARSVVLKTEAGRLVAQIGNPQPTRDEIRRLDVRAELITRLRLCVSPTRVLQAVASSLPQYVSLTRCNLVQADVAHRNAREKPKSSNTPPPNSKSPGERDLEKLIEEAQKTAIVVTLEGLAPDDMAVSAYLGALQKTNLFDEIHLAYSDRTSYGEHILRGFRATLRVRRPEKPAPLESTGTIAGAPPARNGESG